MRPVAFRATLAALFLIQGTTSVVAFALVGRLTAEVGRLLAEVGASAVLVTHDRGEALALGRRVSVLMGGRIVQTGAPEEVFRQPGSAADRTSAQTRGCNNLAFCCQIILLGPYCQNRLTVKGFAARLLQAVGLPVADGRRTTRARTRF